MLFALTVVSCGDKDETIDYIRRTEIHYLNESGVTPILLDFYSAGQKKLSVLFYNNDTTFVATESSDYRWAMPMSHDSVIVTFGNLSPKTYNAHGAYEDGVKNPCRSACYEKETISNTQRKYTFTFTKDMIE